MPSTKNKLRVGRYKRGRPPKLKSEETEPAIRRGRGRPPSDDRFIATQIFLKRESTTNSRNPTTTREWVLRLMRLSHVRAERRNKKVKRQGSWVPGDLDWTQDKTENFYPSGPGGTWVDGDFANHVQFKTTYRNVLRHLKKLKPVASRCRDSE